MFMLIRAATFLFCTAMLATGQTNILAATNQASAISLAPAGKLPGQPGLPRIADIRADCIQNRRLICGKILQVLPDGLVIDCGYTNLFQRPLGRSWLVPGTVLAGRAPNLVEGHEPGALCAGLVFLTDYPKSRRAKPRPFDYAILTGYPAGQYTYPAVGTLRRTVRRFSASLSEAVNLNLSAVTKAVPARGVAAE